MWGEGSLPSWCARTASRLARAGVGCSEKYDYLCKKDKETDKKMDNTRLSKVNRLIQKEVSELFRLQTSAMPGVLITVTSVSISADLGIARIRLSIFPTERSAELLENIRSNTATIRYDLGQRVRHQLRKLPELAFHIDDSLDYLERIDTLLKQ